jgi:hypothetical protein
VELFLRFSPMKLYIDFVPSKMVDISSLAVSDSLFLLKQVEGRFITIKVCMNGLDTIGGGYYIIQTYSTYLNLIQVSYYIGLGKYHKD